MFIRSGNKRLFSLYQYGLTLIELLVTLVILSILATAAIPYVEITVTRTKELELRRNLREIRTAIDRFHNDWATGKIAKSGSDASDNGYPKTLRTLVDGVEESGATGIKHRYLRNIPNDPFATENSKPEEQWTIRGYQDESDSIIWNGKDVYDVRSKSERTAIDGTHYKGW
jgi:general secretion pathway protein G